MDHFFLQMQQILLAKSLHIHIDDRKDIFIPAKTCLGEAHFLPLVKAKNQLQNFEKQLKQKRCAKRCLNFPNFWYLKKKSG